MWRLLQWAAALTITIALLVAVASILLVLLVDPDSRAAQLPDRLDASPMSKYVTVPLAGTDGVTLHYLETGQEHRNGPVFVLLHGFTFNAFTWQAQLGQLARHGRVIAVDQLPYGLSEKPVPGGWEGPGPYTRESAVRLVGALLDALDVTQVILVGNSSGGTLAAEFALAEPQRVAGLVLVAPWVYVTRPVLPRWLVDSLPIRRLTLFAARQLGERMPLVASSFSDADRVPEGRLVLARLHTQTRNWDLAWAALLDQSLTTRISLADDIDRIGQPVLVLSGDRDRLVPIEASRRFAGNLPNAEFRRLVGCGHVAHEECPIAFAVAMRDWLFRQDLTGPSAAGAVDDPAP